MQNIVHLSNDESAFSYGGMNETIHVNSHIEEEFMMEDVESDIIMIENVDELKDPMLWERFDKDIEDFTIEEVRKLRFKCIELCREFYKFYAKMKGFEVRENGLHKSRIDGHPTSKIYKCSAEGLCEQKHVDNPKQVRAPKPLTKCLCEAEIRSKWIKDADY